MTAHACVPCEVPVGVNLFRPSQDVEVVGVEDKLICLVHVTGCHRNQEREEDAEPEVCRGPEEVIVPIHRSVEPPRRNGRINALDVGMSYGLLQVEHLLTV